MRSAKHVVVTAVAVAGLVVAAGAHRDARAARSSLVQYRIATCWHDRRAAFEGIRTDELEIRSLITAALANNSNPNAQRDATRILETYDATVERAHPRRDCSPAGIAKYVGQKPPTK